MDFREPPKTDEGINYVTLLPGKSGRTLVMTGRKFDATAGETTNDDYQLPETREIQGASVSVDGHEPGDYIEMTARGDTGEGEVQLGVFAESIYIPPDGKIEQIVAESTVSFPTGFKVRMSYVAVSSGSTRVVYVAYRMRHG